MHNGLDNQQTLPPPNRSSPHPIDLEAPAINGATPEVHEPTTLSNGIKEDLVGPGEESRDEPSDNAFLEPQPKRRKTADTRAVSPPWKRHAVEGPTSFTVNGKRVSARTNAVPLELQPPSDKRTTRAKLQESTTVVRSRHGGLSASKSSPVGPPAAAATSPTRTRRASSRVAPLLNSSPAKSSPKSRNQSTLIHNPPSPTIKRRRRLSKLNPERTSSSPPPSKPATPETKRRPGRPRKQPLPSQEDSTASTSDSSEADDEHEPDHNIFDEANNSPGGASKSTPRIQRLKFTVRKPTLSIQHPANMARPRKHSSFQAWVENSNFFDTPGEGSLTKDQAQEQAAIRDRIYKAAQPGGLLSPGRCGQFQPERAEEPEKQYAQWDRLTKHVENFRRLLHKERNRHRNEARKLAHECVARWKELQPQKPETEEDFQTRISEAIMRQCIKDLEDKFDMLRQEVVEWQRERYNERKEIDRRQKLNVAIEQSEKVLEASRGAHGPDSTSEEESQHSSATSASSSEENMSSEPVSAESGDNADVDDDKLSASELQRKYQKLRAQSSDGPADKGRVLMDSSPSKRPVNLPNGPEAPARRRRARARGAVDSDQMETSQNELLDETEESTEMDSEKDTKGEDEEDDVVEESTSDSEALAAFSGGAARSKKSSANLVDTADADTDEDDEDYVSDESPSDHSDESEESSSAASVNGHEPTLSPGLQPPAPFRDEPNDAEYSNGLRIPSNENPQDITEAQYQPSNYQNVYEMDDEFEIDEVSLIHPDGVELLSETPPVRNGTVRRKQSASAVMADAPESPSLEIHTAGGYAPLPNGIHLASNEREHDALEPVTSDNAVTTENTDSENQGDRATVDTNTSTSSLHENLNATQAPSKPVLEETDSMPLKAEMPQAQNILMADEPAPMEVQDSSVPTATSLLEPRKMDIPVLLRGKLREYQYRGLEWLAGLYDSGNGAGGILADEMGLGKTIQTIAVFAHLAEAKLQWGPHLVVCPTSVIINWEMEFKKFLPGFKILAYHGDANKRKEKRKGWLDDNKWNVVITSYQVVQQDAHSFKRRKWHYMVLDEAHFIKNWQSQKWQILIGFNTYCRLLLTGTPLQNNISELWSLLFFIAPRDEKGRLLLPGLDEFQHWFRKPVNQLIDRGQNFLDAAGKASVKDLHSVLRPYLLRRLKMDVEKQMPRKYEHVVYCRLSKRQRHLYDGFMSRTETKATLASGNYLSIINCLMQLRKVCNHPDLFETRPIVTSLAMSKSAVADFEIKELLVRRRLLHDEENRIVNLDVTNMLPGANGPVNTLDTIVSCRLSTLGRMRQIEDQQAPYLRSIVNFDGSSVRGSLAFWENAARHRAIQDLRHRSYLNSLRSQRRPLFSYSLAEQLQMHPKCLPQKPQPAHRAQWSEWFSSSSPAMSDLVKTLSLRSELMKPVIQRFSCTTPAVTAPGLTECTLSRPGISVIQDIRKTHRDDAFHEARMRLSIAFPDKRLLQWDCGKLQRLDALLRQLQAGGHRALIFTQMTKVLDILEQFLNIHGHRYLRLDGTVKTEQRHYLTERFNHDPRILCFILSSRSGGLGINLTGADTVIFYDLDWNPAMDKQCQDRCHRIGQTREVHVYRLVSEHTIEANILRKSNQKRLLDDVIIQEGDFTTDHFSRVQTGVVLGEESDALRNEIEADGAAMVDRAMGTGKPSRKILEQAEDKEDVNAARIAAREMDDIDKADKSEAEEGTQSGKPRRPATHAPPATPADEKGKRARNTCAATATGAAITSDTYRHGTVSFASEAAEDVFQGNEPIGIDAWLLAHAFHEFEALGEAERLTVMGIKEKKRKKEGTEHILAKKKEY